MEEIVSAYKALIDKLDEELAAIPKSMQGELLDVYQKILKSEKEKLITMLKTLQ